MALAGSPKINRGSPLQGGEGFSVWLTLSGKIMIAAFLLTHRHQFPDKIHRQRTPRQRPRRVILATAASARFWRVLLSPLAVKAQPPALRPSRRTRPQRRSAAQIKKRASPHSSQGAALPDPQRHPTRVPPRFPPTPAAPPPRPERTSSPPGCRNRRRSRQRRRSSRCRA